MVSSEKRSGLGPFKPTLIIHGGAGSLSRTNLPPALYAQYHASLLTYLTATRRLLDAGTSALEAACLAVTLLEDDPLFNCGRGSVFTERGTIEMEASVMVCSVNPAGPSEGGIKRGAAVSLIKNTRHPILLAKNVLMSADEDHGLGGTSTMHCHLSGRDVEEWGWAEKGLEKKPDRWFWTKRRWEEHRRGLHHDGSYTYDDLIASVDPLSARLDHENDDDLGGVKEIPSQGTVGAVCLDAWGNLAVATSTGGLTNKKAGRIGDTPTIGAGFWAEAWEEDMFDGIPGLSHQIPRHVPFMAPRRMPALDQLWAQASIFLGPCLNPLEPEDQHTHRQDRVPQPAHPSSGALKYHSYSSPPLLASSRQPILRHRRAIAMSGTGNGDSFLRTDACRTAASICRLGYPGFPPLSNALRSIAGPNGELQRSAGDRWGKTGEGQGGIIGIEVIDEITPETLAGSGADRDTYEDEITGLNAKRKRGKAVFDFNCGGLFRAYYEVKETGEETPKVMVFKEEY